jgi:hypothetical protein
LDCFPLVIAQRAVAFTRHAVGTPVFDGMIAASVFGIFLIPLHHITAERLRGLPLTIGATPGISQLPDVVSGWNNGGVRRSPRRSIQNRQRHPVRPRAYGRSIGCAKGLPNWTRVLSTPVIGPKHFSRKRRGTSGRQ